LRWERFNMFPAALVLAQAMASASPPVILPTNDELASAVSRDRFRDDCVGEGGDGCPPINIYRVVTRRAKCHPAQVPHELVRYSGRPVAAAECRFQSAVTTRGRRIPTKPTWTSGRATIYLLESQPFCSDPSRKENSLCDRLWVTNSN
jgi:hypothetical protein